MRDEWKRHTLEESHARWKKHGHDPKFCCAWEEAIPRVNKQDQNEIDMEHQHGSEDNPDIPEPHAKRLAISVKQVKLGEEDECVCYGSNYVADTKRVEVGIVCAIQ